MKIEDYRRGYPRYTSLLAAYEPYFVCRRFSRLRARLFLLKQDKVSLLEKQLNETDTQETVPIFLGVSRCDGNLRRQSLLSQLESALADYDEFVQRTFRVLSYPSAEKRDVRSLRNWLNGTGCIAEDETAYLSHDRELISLASAGDSAMVQMESWVEDNIIRFWRGFRKRRFHDLSDDPHVNIYSGQLIKRIARALLLFLVTLFLLLPIILCNIIDSLAPRIAVVMICTLSFLLILSALTKSRTMELILAGATQVQRII